MRLDQRASGGPLDEWDTVHCPHCQGIVYRARRGAGLAHFTLVEGIERDGTRLRVVRREVEAAWCSDCGAHVCDAPRCATVCVPFVQRIDAYFSRRTAADAARR